MLIIRSTPPFDAKGGYLHLQAIALLCAPNAQPYQLESVLTSAIAGG